MNSSHRSPISVDAFSDVLRHWNPPEWRAGLVDLSAPWGIQVSGKLAGFYLVLAGQCVLTQSSSGNQKPLCKGQAVLWSQGSGHHLQDAAESHVSSYSDILDLRGQGRPTQRGCEEMGLAPSGNGEDPGKSAVAKMPVPILSQPRRGEPMVRLIYGHFSTALPGVQTLTAGIEPLVCFDTESCPAFRNLDSFVQSVLDEQAARKPGWEAVVDHLVLIVFFQVLRAFVREAGAARDADPGSFTAALRASLDDTVAPALSLMHRYPDRPWSVVELAHRANVSKSSFSEHFRQVLGKPPLQYLTEYRVRVACQLLRDTELGVKEISARVGYRSVSSFSNVFKRWTGQAPAAFRRINQQQH